MKSTHPQPLALLLGLALIGAGTMVQGGATNKLDPPSPNPPPPGEERGAATRTEKPYQAPATNQVWDRIVMIGASATAGFTESEPLGGPITSHLRLSRYMEAALTGTHQPVRNLASTFFFMQPEQEAQRQIELALEAKPSLIIGVDFLFWFCYGDGGTDQDRALRFENGLKWCERLRCPLVLGDIPDASAALNRMLTSDEMPSPTALAAANRRLREWARTQRRVTILPLAAFMKAVSANQPLSVHSHNIPAGQTAALLQSDRLHPSPQGCAVLALMALHALDRIITPEFAKQVRWDPAEVLRRADNIDVPAAGAAPPSVTQPLPAASGK